MKSYYPPETSEKTTPYYPSAFNYTKYFVYLKYLLEYLKYGDYTSVIDSLNYTVLRKFPKHNRYTTSKLGRFYLRGSSNDFQFINWTYERSVREFIHSQQRQCGYSTFIDIGACIGEYCVWLATQGIRCIAFEPVQKNFMALQENISLNRVEDQVKIFNYGLGKERQEVYFDIKDIVTSSSHIVRDYTAEAANVSIRSFDDMVVDMQLHVEDKIIIKLDVEGMELDVLEGAKQFLAQAENIIIIFEKTVSGEDEIKRMLDSLGQFEYHDIDEVNIAGRKMANPS